MKHFLDCTWLLGISSHLVKNCQFYGPLTPLMREPFRISWHTGRNNFEVHYHHRVLNALWSDRLSRRCMIGSSPIPSPSSVSKLGRRHTRRLRKRENLLKSFSTLWLPRTGGKQAKFHYALVETQLESIPHSEKPRWNSSSNVALVETRGEGKIFNFISNIFEKCQPKKFLLENIVSLANGRRDGELGERETF